MIRHSSAKPTRAWPQRVPAVREDLRRQDRRGLTLHDHARDRGSARHAPKVENHIFDFCF